VRKQATTAAIVLIVIAAAVYFWHTTKTKPRTSEEKHDASLVEMPLEAQQNAGIVTALSSEQRIQQKVVTTGVISPDEARVAHIVPLSQGIVESVLVQLGDRVQKGQPLLIYDNIELGESISEYENTLGALQKALAQQQVAKRSVDRANSLIQAEAISPREFEVRKAESEQAQAEVDSRRAEVARAEEKLHRFGLTDTEIKQLSSSGQSTHRTASHNTVRAPLSGVVTKYDVSKGEVVSRDKELFTIVDTTTVWALADVYEKDIQYVARGGECGVTVASYAKDAFKGTISYLSDALDPASRTAKLRCVVPNVDGRLKLEMFATVTVPTRESRMGITVPLAALQEINGQPVVFVQKEPTKFERRTVQLGQKDEQTAEVTAGLQPGEIIVSNGSFYLKSALMRELIGGED